MKFLRKPLRFTNEEFLLIASTFLLDTHIHLTPLSLQFLIPLSDRMLWYSIHQLKVSDKKVLRRKFTIGTRFHAIFLYSIK
jgi:hypothetical protein